MTHTHYADMFITLMLGWIRAVTNWIWSMIRLGRGSAGRGFLSWFSDHWVQLVVALMLACVAVDWLVWLVRWRPYWLWFGKKRRLINDMPKDARPAPRRRERPAESAPARRAAAPQFHSQALPRQRRAAAPDDLFDVSPASAPVPRAPEDLFDVAPADRPEPPVHGARPKAAGARTGAPAPAKAQSQKRSSSHDSIDWFE